MTDPSKMDGVSGATVTHTIEKITARNERDV